MPNRVAPVHLQKQLIKLVEMKHKNSENIHLMYILNFKFVIVFFLQPALKHKKYALLSVSFLSEFCIKFATKKKLLQNSLSKKKSFTCY